jgi:hypothetical protein
MAKEPSGEPSAISSEGIGYRDPGFPKENRQCTTSISSSASIGFTITHRFPVSLAIVEHQDLHTA